MLHTAAFRCKTIVAPFKECRQQLKIAVSARAFRRLAKRPPDRWTDPVATMAWRACRAKPLDPVAETDLPVCVMGKNKRVENVLENVNAHP
jgi:hypothetical protein